MTLTRRTFQFVVNLVRNSVEKRDSRFREAVSIEKRVAVALWRLASQKRTELLPPRLELESLLLSRSQTVLLTS